ncbi:Fe2+ or Zn2+ uptake regulation protein [Geosporobacter subterraneus DSM 17957]|uniref:Fe2+ or Zn2+ uptake regulation protein n=1 Tax=Geosporobacter subterraneus DSM 17957 TaxID=1121919 RepID=A0A1M6D1L5_9FIRM|nr:Fur family transcriptional regulator [Geosporobacter subterraneus]SHI67146.1 Fe2+ or Zn2+ uptake regulation protein [Geosporobacter subterraneus DSM 17957]
MEDQIKNLTAILERKNIRPTPKRKEILKAFVNTNNHLKPEELYNLVKNKGVGLATTYRNLELLKKNGIIKEIKIDNERYYELKIYSQKCLHIHLKCSTCGSIYDCAETGLVLNMLKLQSFVESLYDFEAVDLEIVMEGVCKKCRR